MKSSTEYPSEHELEQQVETLHKPLMILIALLQGLALLYLHEAIEFEFWPHGQMPWLFLLYTLAIVTPTLFLLSLSEGRGRSLAVYIIPFSMLAALVAWYVGGQGVPEHSHGYDKLAAPFAFTLALASFKLLMYAQQSAEGGPVSYSQLFRFSWRNFITLALSLLFMLVFWGILVLWAQLFKVININFFESLFEERWFLYPALAMAHGLGVIIFREQYKIIDTITRIQQALFKFLLPILIIIAVMFLIALPFTGLAPLWETGNGSMLILWLQALTLFFVNAVYQDEDHQRPYPALMHRLIYFGVALLPIYGLISGYGLWLRVAQYGWTVDRGWGVLIWALLALFSLGYLWGIARRRDNWIADLSWVNVRMGLLFLALMLLVNSPLLDFRKISANSQLARLDAGTTSYADFDVRYFQRSLAAPGYAALMALKQEDKAIESGLAARIVAAYSNQSSELSEQDKSVLKDQLVVWPEENVVPEDLYVELETWYEAQYWRRAEVHTVYLISGDFNQDNKIDYLAILMTDNTSSQILFSRGDQRWQQHNTNYIDLPKPELFKQLLLDGDIQIARPEWGIIKVGENIIQVNETVIRHKGIAR